jgi:hypothetical protein
MTNFPRRKFDVTAAVMGCSTFWDITPCSAVKANRCFVDTRHLHLQCPSASINQATNRNMFLWNVNWYQRTTRSYILKDITLLFKVKFTTQFSSYSYAVVEELQPQKHCTSYQSCRGIYGRKRQVRCAKLDLPHGDDLYRMHEGACFTILPLAAQRSLTIPCPLHRRASKFQGRPANGDKFGFYLETNPSLPASIQSQQW